ncbi:MAG: hypothetical protein A2748_00865 [Candidatus Wildermuthbacteria bacterium RIFCSPHIGHO2_01_FULL_45_20]|uniref:Clp R domain-containing protein n=1 Tax=Candidatus Wildermuthbacteria bacterium RIFCSPHIGHO2_02_FULL_45_25 TaxID=1802450 RepID=A0A1G2R2X2_9BACT|nr:MAG: hypothetical protein A2748_00865 [Candidatus Wildermuthbacteria bacterium RIFCSPHIGHO2_01_FULL_45_20]OHA66431.1 MAG: hypothetical protein A3C04_01235 [Candidatus Wildermuthbacteria bacterium RIFCSPHIGHO2_02_FULL_45_25]
MSSFNVKKAAIYQVISLNALISLGVLARLATVSLWLGFACFGGFLVLFVAVVSAQEGQEVLFGVSLLLFAYSAAVFALSRFGEYLKRARISAAYENEAEFLGFEPARAVLRAETIAKQEKLAMVSATVLVIAICKEQSSAIRFMSSRMLLDIKALEKELRAVLAQEPKLEEHRKREYSEDFAKTCATARRLAKEQGRERIESEDLIAALATECSAFKQLLIERNFLPDQEIPDIARWHLRIRQKNEERSKFWLKKNLRRYGALGTDWASGYTITLDLFSLPLTKEAARLRFPLAVGHEKEKAEMQRILCRQENNNVLLVGEPGSGRKRLVLDLASRSALGDTKSELLAYRRILEIDMAHLVSSAQSTEELEETLSRVFSEAANAGNVIVVIDELHNYVGGETGTRAEPGRVNIATILSAYLRLPQFVFVGITTFAGLHRYFEQNPSLLSRFGKVEMSEISEDETLEVLEETLPSLEVRYKRFVSYQALQSILRMSGKYIQAVPFPQKALDLLDEAMSYVAQTRDPILLPAHIAAVVESRTQIPVGEMEDQEREKLLDLETLIHKRLINQDIAVQEVSAALRRARTQIASRQGPMGSFLFMGPTGVGKTEMAKALAAIYFGSESRMIRLDMSEFQNLEDIKRLLGSPSQEGLLTTAVRENPFSLVLLDELEKAHSNILNLFLQVLDEGHVTDGIGRKIDFRYTIIIATSNAGYELILRALKEKKDFGALKEEMLEYVFERGIYRPEFINRFDGVIIFTPLSEQHLIDIAGLMLSKVRKNLAEQGIGFVITEELKREIARLGYNPMFGARDMRRVLQDKVENAIALALLGKKIKRGQNITVDAETFETRVAEEAS